jgi:hypothetical protein
MARGISQGIHKLTQTPTLIKKNIMECVIFIVSAINFNLAFQNFQLSSSTRVHKHECSGEAFFF